MKIHSCMSDQSWINPQIMKLPINFLLLPNFATLLDYFFIRSGFWIGWMWSEWTHLDYYLAQVYMPMLHVTILIFIIITSFSVFEVPDQTLQVIKFRLAHFYSSNGLLSQTILVWTNGHVLIMTLYVVESIFLRIKSPFSMQFGKCFNCISSFSTKILWK